MARRPPLRFTRLDALIVAVAIALGVLLARVEPADIEAALGLTPTMPRLKQLLEAARAEGRAMTPKLATWYDRAIFGFLRGVEYVEPALPVATLGLALATFRHRGALARPGRRSRGVMTTALASTFVLVFLGTEYLERRFPQLLTRGYGVFFFTEIWPDLSRSVGLATLAAWVVMTLGGYARGRPGWHDRLGRALGWAWIAAMSGRTLLHYYFV